MATLTKQEKEIQKLGKQVLELKPIAKEYETKKEALNSIIKGLKRSFAFPNLRIDYSFSSPERFDLETFKTENPEIYLKYLVKGTRETVTVS